jgi:ribosome-binding protein aMBF1 (putative translation factor)
MPVTTPRERGNHNCLFLPDSGALAAAVPRSEAPRVADQLRAVGRRVAELRADRSLTQEQLAEQLSMTPGHLKQIERGLLNLTVRSLVRLADGLAVPLAELFVEPNDMAPRRGRPPKRDA